MNYEVEQKYPVEHFDEVQRLLELLGATAHSPIEQVDQYFNHPARDFGQTDEALRIRRVGQDNRLTYKGPKIDATTKTRQEMEIAFEPGEAGRQALASILLALGFRSVAEVRKVRKPFELRWQGELVEIALDAVECVGTYVELELIAEAQALEQAKANLASLAQTLGLTKQERRSYLELLLAKKSTL